MKDPEELGLARRTRHGLRCVATGKRCRSRSEQARWLAEYRRSKAPWQPRLYAYECPVCSWYHATKQKPKPKKPKKRR